MSGESNKTIGIMEEVSKSLPFIGFNEAARNPWIHHSWSGGRLKYKRRDNKIILVVSYEGQKKQTVGYVPDVLDHLPDEISEPFLYVLHYC